MIRRLKLLRLIYSLSKIRKALGNPVTFQWWVKAYRRLGPKYL